jgi:hypothetical protein
MVRGLKIFQQRFAAYVDQYVLIGGTAASLTMQKAGLEFRATKDLDVVLHVEVLTPAFGTAFWQFVEEGGYEIRQASDTEKPIFYRFQKPADDRFPAMIELFARAPDGLQPASGSQLTRWQLAARAGQRQVLGEAAQVLPIRIGRMPPAERFHPVRQRHRRAQRTAASDQYGTSPPNTCVS